MSDALPLGVPAVAPGAAPTCASPATPIAWRTRLLCWIVVAAALLVAHGGALWHGVFFDDHWHRYTLSTYGWTWGDLVESNTFSLPGYNNLWWQVSPMEWRYARPLWMLLMKVQHLATAGDPVLIHACGLVWAWLVTILVLELALFAGLAVPWALFAAVLFVVNPHSVGAVSWNACRNTMMGDFFLLASVLVYARASFASPALSARRLRWRQVAALAIWLPSLLVREANVIFPLLVLALDACFGGERQLRARWRFLLLALALAAAYVFWRMVIFSYGRPGPPKIYFFFEPTLAYIPWAFSKLLQTTFCHFAATPPIGGLATHRGVFWLYHWREYAVIAVVLVGVAVVYAWLSRGQRGRWFWPAWIVLFMLPIIPLSLLPYLLYTSFAGLAIMVAIALSRLARPWLRRTAAAVVLASTVANYINYQTLYAGLRASEQMYYDDIFDQPPLPKPGDTVFFINQPVINLYAPLPIRAGIGSQDLHGWTLTLADHHIYMRQPSALEVVGDRTLILSMPAPGYFSSIVGQYLLDETRPGQPLSPGAVTHTPHFDVEVLEGGGTSVLRLKFTFRKPLASPDYHFYFSSPRRAAYQLDFASRPPAAQSPETAKLFAEARSTDASVRRAARARMAAVAGPLAVQCGSPLQFALAADPNLDRDALVEEVEAWWRQVDADRLSAERSVYLQRRAGQMAAQQRYYAIHYAIRNMISSDLLATGPRTDPDDPEVRWPWVDPPAGLGLERGR